MQRWRQLFTSTPLPTLETEFQQLVRKHGLEGKVHVDDVTQLGCRWWTLYRLIREGGEDRPLPAAFVAAVETLLRRRAHQIHFRVSLTGISASPPLRSGYRSAWLEEP